MRAAPIESLLNGALAAEIGLLVTTDNHRAARALRRKLYAFRDLQRASGRKEYDLLSFVVRKCGDLLIVKRTHLNNQSAFDVCTIRELQNGEQPGTVASRGKRRSGLLFAFLKLEAEKVNTHMRNKPPP